MTDIYKFEYYPEIQEALAQMHNRYIKEKKSSEEVIDSIISGFLNHVSYYMIYASCEMNYSPEKFNADLTNIIQTFTKTTLNGFEKMKKKNKE